VDRYNVASTGAREADHSIIATQGSHVGLAPLRLIDIAHGDRQRGRVAENRAGVAPGR
jgi:hypothetical protein